MRLLLAEDEEAMADAVTAFLEYHHYEVDWASNGLDALEYARTGIYDVLVLDIMMPGMDGLTVLRTLRNEGNATPVLLLTAKGEVRDKVLGFESGSDDYLTKPFALEELRVRIEALARRGQVYQGEQASFGNLAMIFPPASRRSATSFALTNPKPTGTSSVSAQAGGTAQIRMDRRTRTHNNFFIIISENLTSP